MVNCECFFLQFSDGCHKRWDERPVKLFETAIRSVFVCFCLVSNKWTVDVLCARKHSALESSQISLVLVPSSKKD